MAETAPDAFMLQLATEVIDAVKADKAIQAGDVGRIRVLVDTKIVPHVNLQRMVIKSVGPPWRSASPEQQKRLTEEFKSYLINTYAGALTTVKDQSVKLRPMRAGGNPSEVVVGTDVVGKGEPIQLDYRLEKAGEAWKIYDFNVLGLWATDIVSQPVLTRPQCRRHRRADRSPGREEQGHCGQQELTHCQRRIIVACWCCPRC